ncbi:hypothetical protein LEP1GSC049_1531 [Leptospira kirschneri serovar Cynopteri str. 3522 CT]|uniref:Uncharacterized protein n=1 Tax=Leptospira kirschneri str. 200802841 TaxID=1193047 RepID=A0A828Y2U3_9LEPT|nr:hypothetical protein LEP1GSC044_0759 [Leptospira kirschneri serovar Grippotyphosa str. RM52]EKO51808.1 hypothetical protein LEP1GSC131_1356 [Leptospira kirschneri str. 200802841]EKR08217.1 hypothetical protein LEP1GSC122_2220 [Leptospira kirschneri serovar Valbuzzi str. 200702274]EMN27597.1 hypothetical protein LEP1GSC065_0177 [Leptospira kirschneri serovar Sokoine str. RM1]EPG49115.1 hypothetical protein LEP1GSC049_1531 [Leptospira kirschneri serovar Cynopteri str. 3522 CT]
MAKSIEFGSKNLKITDERIRKVRRSEMIFLNLRSQEGERLITLGTLPKEFDRFCLDP